VRGTIPLVGVRLAIVILSGFLALACDESSDSAGDGDDGSSGSPSMGGSGGTSAGTSSGGDGGASAGTSSGGDGGASAGESPGGDGGTSADGGTNGGAMAGGTGASGGASGGAGAGMSGAGGMSGCAGGGAEAGMGGAGEPAAWTCLTVDDLCECAHDSNGTAESCNAELNCCMTYLVRNECVSEERCFCQPATEEQCADAVERTEPIYMAVRSESCPP
jgi:hypothetical protein